MAAEQAVLHQKNQTKKISIALAGVPNSGKTTLFNALTGMNYKVANYPGVTVEKKEGRFFLENVGEVTLIDLPGTYSLFGGSPDETIAADYLTGIYNRESKPHAIICVVDTCNIQRNLYLASQLLDIGVPVVVALTMTDIATKRGIEVRKELLAKTLGAPVVDISGRTKGNLSQLTSVLGKTVASGDEKKSFGWCEDKSFREAALDLGRLYVSKEHEANNISLETIGIGLLSGAREPGSDIVKEAVQEKRKELEAIGIDPSSFEAELRYDWAGDVLQRSVKFGSPSQKNISNTIDAIVTHKIWGGLIFVLLMTLIFQAIFAWASIPMDLIDGLFADLRNLVIENFPESDFRSLVADGIVSGAGGVLIFVPQIAILYFFISILEESGYLSRAACLMDRIMRKFGLQGRSFIPLLSSFACAIPGIMSTRTIPSFADRMATIMVAPLMSCSARLPVYALLIAAFVPATYFGGVVSLQGLVLLSMYLLGIIGAAFAALIFKKTIFKGTPTHFIMEMPPYRLPQWGQVFRNVWDRVFIFMKDAGTVIMACSIVLWFLASYPKVEGETAEKVKQSYAGQMGQFIEPVIAPLGFDWKIGVSIVASFAAREVFVSSMALVHNLEDADETSDSLIEAVRGDVDAATGIPKYTLATALSLMVFYVYACQCLSTLAICKRETGSWKWPAFMFLYMTVLAYIMSFLTYQLFS